MAKRDKGSPRKEEQVQLTEGFENLDNGGWGSKISSWLRKNFSSVLLPVIALIVLASGIYLYSQQQTPSLTTEEGGQALTESGINLDEGLNKEEVTEEGVTQEQELLGQGGPEQTKEDQVVSSAETEPRFVGDQILVAANPGEGITHLARRSFALFLEKRASSELKTKLTPEHKIFIEDFMQNRTGDFGLEVGQELSFSETLIQDAIDAALQLNDAQLKNLEQFSQLVPSLT